MSEPQQQQLQQQQQQQQQQNQREDSDGVEIQNIGYETVSELSTQNHQDNKASNDAIKAVRSGICPAKKSKDPGVKIHEDVAVSSSSSSSQNDICRICHMGNNSISLVSCSDGTRTPFNLGQLVSACRCRGSVGLVHTGCLERWLTESGHTRCELCGYRYATIRVPRHGVLRSLLIWMKTFVATRQMLLDSLYLVVTTPLAVFSAYVCAMTLKMALDNRINDIPWTIVAMLPTCSLTLVAYWGWLLTLQRLHGRRWRQYWQSNFIIQLVPDTPIDDNQQDDDLDMYHDDVYEDLPDLFNLL